MELKRQELVLDLLDLLYNSIALLFFVCVVCDLLTHAPCWHWFVLQSKQSAVCAAADGDDDGSLVPVPSDSDNTSPLNGTTVLFVSH